jgi:hypothetical protein
MGGGGAAAYKPSVPAGPPVPLPKLMEKVLESLAQQDKFKYFKAPVTDEVVGWVGVWEGLTVAGLCELYEHITGSDVGVTWVGS